MQIKVAGCVIEACAGDITQQTDCATLIIKPLSA